MTRKLEELFDLPTKEDTASAESLPPPSKEELIEINNTIDKIEAALPMVKGLDASDSEMDELASKAVESYESLIDLGMQVDSRFASEILSVAGTMLGHAITAKTAKMNKKLKMIDLQLRKLKLDQDQARHTADNEPDSGATEQGHVLDRNDLLQRLIGDRNQISK